MAEFVQTMKDWKRMCKAMDAANPNNACAVCLLRKWGCPAIYEDDRGIDYAVLAERIEAWAAEHPEPVYPTWGEWLQEIGVAEVGSGMLSIHPAIAEQPIPASFAQEHWIEPKEG